MYSSLDSTQIRLVKIEPLEAGQEDDCPIHLNMTVHGINDGLKYAAVSYEWGQPDCQLMVNAYINGEPVVILSNLRLALERFRGRKMKDYIWIDAICINQKDRREKAKQVEKMHEIFALSTITCVWLGPSTNDSHLATDFLRLLRSEGSEAAAHASIKVSLTGPGRDDLVQALINLMSRTYWRRAWIVQELVFGSTSHCIFACGNEDTFPFHTLGWLSTAPTFRNSLPSDDSAFRLTRLEELLLSFKKIFYLSRFWERQPEVFNAFAKLPDAIKDFFDLLSTFQIQLATDSRDKVYSLLHIKDFVQPLKVDYTDSFTYHMLFKQVAIALTQRMRNFSIFHACEGPNDDLPSWVPDWTRQQQQTWKREMHHAGGEEYNFADFVESQNVLHTKAHIIGKICDLRMYSLREESTVARIIENLYDFIRLCRAQSEDSAHDPREILHTVHALITGPTQSHCIYTFEQFYQDCDDHRTSEGWSRATQAHWDVLFGFSTQTAFFQCILNTTNDIHRERKSASASQPWKLFGTARRKTTRVHDLVMAIPGCGYLVIARSLEGVGRFELIGLAYMADFMNGEALTLFPETDIYLV